MAFLFAEFSLTQDLSALSRGLKQRDIAHRFTEEGGIQKLWLANESDISEVQLLLENPELVTRVPESEDDAGNDSGGDSDTHEPSKFSCEFTIFMLVLGLAGYLVVLADALPIYQALGFLPLDVLLPSGQWWRLVTPVFFHFSIMHIVFNALWIWEVGKRLEPFLGRWQYLGLFVCCAVVSNILQYSMGGSINFGGLSGVVYGYFGCIFFLARRYPRPLLFMPPGIYVFMLVWLLLGFAGIIDFFVAGSIANWAHLGGLIAGALYAGVMIATKGLRSNSF